MSATLGGLIKDLRLQKNISQLEIAFTLGWKEPSRLSRIEQGKVANPPRKVIDKIIEAMRLSEEEKNQILFVGNYLPTSEEIDNAIQRIKPSINDWKYPATCMDFAWRAIYANNKMYETLNLSKNSQKFIVEEHPSLVEITFDENFKLNKDSKGVDREARKEFLVDMLANYLYDQRGRTSQRWYQELMKRMLTNNALFREVFPEAQLKVLSGADDLVITNFGFKTFTSHEPKKRPSFYFFVVPLFRDPRFFAELLVPADQATYKQY